MVDGMDLLDDVDTEKIHLRVVSILSILSTPSTPSIALTSPIGSIAES